MKVYKIDITPLSLFRDFPSSYTLFGAISWAYNILYGENHLKEILNSFENGHPLFLISSIFPRKQDKYFFPKPNLKSKRAEKTDIDYKKLKKIRFVDFETLKQILDGKITNELELYSYLNEKAEENISLLKKDAIPHASIDRIFGTTEGSGGLFFEEIVAMQEGYFFIAVENESIKNELKTIFNLLEDIGLGGNRSIGYGRVKFGEFKEFLKHLFYYIKVLPLLAVSEDNLIKAKELCEDVDIKDFPYIAVTLELNGLFWTNDKKLIKGLNNKGFSNIISSEEIFENYFHEKD